MNKIALLALLACIIGAPDALGVGKRPQGPLKPPFDKIFKAGRNQTVQIWHHGRICAGVVVTRRLVLTSWSCVEELRRILIIFDGKSKLGRDEGATVLAKDESADLAILGLSRDFDLAPATFASDPVIDGEPIISIGHPFGKLFRGLNGRAIEPKTEFFLCYAAAESGNTGGPVFNLNGDLVGIVSRRKKFLGSRSYGNCTSLQPAKDIMARITPQTAPLHIINADTSGFLTLGLLKDAYLDELSGTPSTHLTYRVGIDIVDRLRLAWRHTIFRPEHVRSGELSWVFKLGNPMQKPIVISPGFGRNFYKANGKEFSADKLFVEVEWGPSLTYQQIKDDGRTWHAVALEF